MHFLSTSSLRLHPILLVIIAVLWRPLLGVLFLASSSWRPLLGVLILVSSSWCPLLGVLFLASCRRISVICKARFRYITLDKFFIALKPYNGEKFKCKIPKQ